jgi:multicomponent Na+:H+ antiporter subunit A
MQQAVQTMGGESRRAAFGGWAMALLPLALLAAFLFAAPQGATPRILELPFGRSDELGVRLTLRLDGLSILFGILITGIGALIFGYAGHYMGGRPGTGRFYLYLTLFMLSMLGVVTAENVIVLFVFWELTSITSWLLIGFEHEKETARDSALQALLVTGGGGMALLAGLVLLGSVAGSFELTEIAAQAGMLRDHELYGAILTLVVLGAVTKSAQVPFHFWLPSAMAAPTPVSGYLHSATMVKAGVYLLARLLFTLGGTPEWMTVLTIAGALTMATGAIMAIFASDLKQILAYSTVSALGSLVMLLGIGTPAAVKAAVVFLVAHALYKAALFLVAGIIDHETGTRDVERLGGLRRAMPFTAATAIIGGVSLASFGPVLSFAGKEMVVMAVAATGRWSVPLQVVIYFSAMLIAGAAALVAIRPFFGQPREDLPAHDPAPGMWLAPALLASAGVILALAPHRLTALILRPAAGAIHPEAADFYVELWHGINAPLLMAAAATAVGLLLYRTRTRWLGPVRPLRVLGRFGPLAGYRLFLKGTLAFAGWQARLLQSGYLHIYLLIILVTLLTLFAAALLLIAPLQLTFDLSDARIYEIVVALLIVGGALVAVRSKSRLGAVAALGVVGYSVALIFIFFSAPDLAMTQFLIETLTVILFVLVLYRLPRFTSLTGRVARARDIIIPAVVGVFMTLLVLAATREAAPPELSRFYTENSVGQAHGRNVVNVVLVDFRALDTLGEITVLAVAALGVYALLRMRTQKGEAP